MLSKSEWSFDWIKNPNKRLRLITQWKPFQNDPTDRCNLKLKNILIFWKVKFSLKIQFYFLNFNGSQLNLLITKSFRFHLEEIYNRNFSADANEVYSKKSFEIRLKQPALIQSFQKEPSKQYETNVLLIKTPSRYCQSLNK